MTPSHAISDVEADLAALRAAAERAGTALACLFSTSDEFEAAVVRMRREQRASRRSSARKPLRVAALAALLVLAFVLFRFKDSKENGRQPDGCRPYDRR